MTKITDLEFDDGNIEELHDHGIRPQEVWQLLDDAYTMMKNKKTASGDRKLIGKTHGGRALTLILAQTPVEGLWRPITDGTARTRRKGHCDERQAR